MLGCRIFFSVGDDDSGPLTKGVIGILRACWLMQSAIPADQECVSPLLFSNAEKYRIVD